MNGTVTAPAAGDQIAEGLMNLMDGLLDIVQRETELVRAGDLMEAAALEPKKTELAGRYLAVTTRLKANANAFAQQFPDAFKMLRERHETFRSLLQINLAVLATAHAVAEGIMRGAADEVARKSGPQVYGSSGRATAPAPRSGGPVMLSRTC